MVKDGYASSVAEAREMDARTVLQAMHYERFLSDWHQAFIQLNKEVPS